MNKSFLMILILSCILLLYIVPVSAEFSVSDTLLVDQTKTYNLNGKDYDVKLEFCKIETYGCCINHSFAAFSVNGEMTSWLEIGSERNLFLFPDVKLQVLNITCWDTIINKSTKFNLSTRINDSKFTGEISDYGLDLDSDGLYDYLIFEVGVNITEAGEYYFNARIECNSKEEDIENELLWTRTNLNRGLNDIYLNLSGIWIYDRCVDGIINLTKLELENKSGLIDKIEPNYQTKSYNLNEFEKPGLEVLGINDSVLDINGNGLYDVLMIEVQINVTDARNYKIQGTLMETFETEKEMYLDTDVQLLLFLFDGRYFYNESLDGPYGFYDFRIHSLDYEIYDMESVYFTEAYNHEDFEHEIEEDEEISKLIITDLDVKVDGGKSSNLEDGDMISRGAEPESEIEFEIELTNNFTDEEDIEIEDITVEITIEDIDDGDDLDDESSRFDLDPEEDESISFDFKLPLEVEEAIYDVYIHAEGEDENGKTHVVDWTLELEVEKNKHQIRITDAYLYSSEIDCQDSVSLKTRIINLGSSDEDEIVLEVLNSALGINLVEKNIELEEGIDDNAYERLWTIMLKDILKPGTYPITINAYYDNVELSDSEGVELVVRECIDKTEDSMGQVYVPPSQEEIVPEPVSRLDLETEPEKEKTFFEKIIDWLLALFS